MTAPGWQPDPTGRFGQRWFDGNDWTDSVIAANGQLAHDPFPRELPSSPSQWARQPAARPAPQAQVWQPAQPAPPAQSWQPAAVVPAARAPAVRAPAASTASGSLAVVAMVAVGVAAALFALCFFVLDWIGSDFKFSDVRDLVSDAQTPELLDDIVKLYVEWIGYILAGLVLVAAAVVVLVRSATSHRLRHVLAAALAAIGAVLHAFVVVRLFRGPDDPQFWAWLGTVAYLVILAGLVVSSRRASTSV